MSGTIDDKCVLYGKLSDAGLGATGELHNIGHQIGEMLLKKRPALFHSLASMFSNVSELAKISHNEAFSEGYVVSTITPTNVDGQLLKRLVSHYLANVGSADSNQAPGSWVRV